MEKGNNNEKGNDNEEVNYNNTNIPAETEESKGTEVPIRKNICWKELGLLIAVWIIILGLQNAKIPVTIGVTSCEVFSVYKGRRVMASKGEVVTEWTVKEANILLCLWNNS
ncbi:hypothetical protein PanWU01x14_347440 [Parasponia andersonii]|uniref:Uncharacterized protein n=1 Tax=Parasponia andersonii TaxID=3476 RepID=A0A2P5AC10_PARAD|nr:hypothetical protein PanWU01x14_347440 [Parasponia andersonii]